jgi:hypothetical protein
MRMQRLRLTPWVHTLRALAPAALLWSIAALWLILFSLGASTVLAYALFVSGAPFADVSEQAVSQKLSLFGIGASLIPLVLLALQPLTSVSATDLWPRGVALRRLGPALGQGALLGVVVCAGLTLSGHYEVLGFLPRGEDWSMEIGGSLLRLFALFGLSYSTSLVCFELIPRALLGAGELPREGRRFTRQLVSAVAFALLIRTGFDLGWSQLGTFFLLGLYGSLRTLNEDHFHGAAGFLTGLLATLHLVFGLSTLGVENPGLFVLRYPGPPTGELESTLTRWITGGYGGPLSSLVMGGAITVQALRQAVEANLIEEPRLLRLFRGTR